MVLKGETRLQWVTYTHTSTHIGTNYNLTTVTVPKVPVLIVLQLNFVHFYLPLLDISHKRVMSLCKVQKCVLIFVPFSPVLSWAVVEINGCLHFQYLHSVTTSDIKDLYHTKLEKGHAAAFATDCDLPSTHEMVRSVGMQVCVFFLPWEGMVCQNKSRGTSVTINPGKGQYILPYT